MKLTELLKQCDSDSSAVCLAAKQRLRYHAAEVLPELVNVVREIVNRHKRIDASVGTKEGCNCGYCKVLKPALDMAEEVKDHSEHLTPQPNQPTVTLK